MLCLHCSLLVLEIVSTPKLYSYFGLWTPGLQNRILFVYLFINILTNKSKETYWLLGTHYHSGKL